jgi:multimeric flavodoxin WrbA
MRILAFIGSPRKGGNTDTVVGQILKGSQAKGHSSETVYLYDYEISACADCRQCKGGDYACSIDDGMQEIYPKMEEADLIIFGTPVYWYGPTAKMKLLVDRMRPFVARGTLKGKKALIVAPSEEGPAVRSLKCFAGPLTIWGWNWQATSWLRPMIRGRLKRIQMN